jgi:hypothetical protein
MAAGAFLYVNGRDQLMTVPPDPGVVPESPELAVR